MDFLSSIITPEHILSVIVVVISIVVYSVTESVYSKHKKKQNSRRIFSETTIHLIASVTRVVFVLFVIILVLEINGINITAFVTGLGLASAIIGLALQDALKDIIMGSHIVADRFFDVGDIVKFKEIEGEVISFSILTTKIKSTINDNIYSVSNRNIDAIEVVSGVIDVNIPLPYEVPLADAKGVLEEIASKARKDELIISCNFMGTTNFADSAIEYRLRAYSTSMGRYQARRNILMIAQEVLENHKIEIPYTQIDIHTK